MEGLGSLLLFAALFYFMMRFGCGAHMVHGHGHGGGHGPRGSASAGEAATLGHGASAKDPVCGMDVEPGQGYTKMREGRAYRLCSRACLDQFDANPARYLSLSHASQSSNGGVS